MKILIACEFSGTVREAFTKLGHDVTSCDLLPSDIPGKHYQGDVRDIINDGWDMMIAHPPCTHLAVSGARWFKDKQEEQKQAVKFFMRLVNSDIPKIAVENPICIMSRLYRKPDQIIQPWQFGHGETKSTCLWLKGLPELKPTKIIEKPQSTKIPGNWFNKGGKDRQKNRAKTFQGIADAMAEQWGALT